MHAETLGTREISKGWSSRGGSAPLDPPIWACWGRPRGGTDDPFWLIFQIFEKKLFSKMFEKIFAKILKKND